MSYYYVHVMSYYYVHFMSYYYINFMSYYHVHFMSLLCSFYFFLICSFYVFLLCSIALQKYLCFNICSLLYYVIHTLCFFSFVLARLSGANLGHECVCFCAQVMIHFTYIYRLYRLLVCL